VQRQTGWYDLFVVDEDVEAIAGRWCGGGGGGWMVVNYWDDLTSFPKNI